ncbi:PEP-utilizing protein [Actinomadura logoneensis]|uniref:PEP-utilizing protein n=1 Tax=Actinomadura logoneensis TaxID=2293572 RepID=A0A372JEQ4_9ACTN|nr:putative PEP-binding protein [Actinomadura logoneensis]RFU38314.1 PEP-utilizing protein [Actinomadura logoneensis]
MLVGSRQRAVRGACNRTGKPVDGAVLVVDTLTPERYEAILSSAAVICARGGRTGHMQSLCRSRGIPVLRVDPSELDALTGEVTLLPDRGTVVLGDVEPAPGPSEPAAASLGDIESICVVIADATDIRSTNALGPRVRRATSWFIREEFLCFSAGLSPIDALRAGPGEAEAYGARVADELCAMAEELRPGQRLVMRLLDLRSDDAAKITTRVRVDAEPNPELGRHGARWLLGEDRYPRAFRTLRARLHRRLGPDADRVSFAVPFINDPDEFLRLRRHLGLGDGTPLGVFVETPAAVHSAAGFCAAGAAELFVGTKDLIQFYLAADRGNHLVSSVYQTRHPAVLAALREAVESGHAAGVPVHVFALGADLDHYLRHLPTRRLMMCTAELQHLATRTAA